MSDTTVLTDSNLFSQAIDSLMSNINTSNNALVAKVSDANLKSTAAIQSITNALTSAQDSIAVNYPDGSSAALATLNYILNTKVFTKYSASGGSSSIGYKNANVSLKLGEYLSAFDFMTAAQIQDVSSSTGQMDVTAALQACFDAATQQRRTVYLPDGVYSVSNLSFGSNNTQGHQSASPMGLVGQSRQGTILSVRQGTTGTFLKATSTAGITYRDFSVYGNANKCQLVDWSWNAGAGPSTCSVIHNIFINGAGTTVADVPVIVNLNDYNDTECHKLYVVGTDPNQCVISAIQTGGMLKLMDCQWPGGFLRAGAQNMVLDHCLGMGVEFVQTGYNFTTIIGGQYYGNSAKGCFFWSDAYAINAGIFGFKVTGTYFIADQLATSYINLNMVGQRVDFDNCGYIGTNIPFLGPQSHNASGRGRVRVYLTGGAGITTTSGQKGLNLADAAGHRIIAQDLFDSSTGGLYEKDWSDTPALTVNGNTNTSIVTGISGKWTRQGNLVFFNLRFQWNSATFADGTKMILAGMPFGCDNPEGTLLNIGYSSPAFVGKQCRIVGQVLYIFNTDQSQMDAQAAGDVTISGMYKTTATL